MDIVPGEDNLILETQSQLPSRPYKYTRISAIVSTVVTGLVFLLLMVLSAYDRGASLYKAYVFISLIVRFTVNFELISRKPLLMMSRRKRFWAYLMAACLLIQVDLALNVLITV